MTPARSKPSPSATPSHSGSDSDPERQARRGSKRDHYGQQKPSNLRQDRAVKGDGGESVAIFNERQFFRRDFT
jgi:hypothetical protein